MRVREFEIDIERERERESEREREREKIMSERVGEKETKKTYEIIFLMVHLAPDPPRPASKVPFFPIPCFFL